MSDIPNNNNGDEENNNTGNNGLNENNIRTTIEQIVNEIFAQKQLENNMVVEINNIKKNQDIINNFINIEFKNKLLELEKKILERPTNNNKKYPEDNKFNGKIKTGLEWDIFIHHFNLFYPYPTKADLSNALKDDAHITMCTIDIANDKSINDLIKGLAQLYQKSPELIKRDFIAFTISNKYKTINELVFNFRIVQTRCKINDTESIQLLFQALGKNFIEYWSSRALPNNLSEFIIEIFKIHDTYFKTFGISLYLTDDIHTTFRDMVPKNPIINSTNQESVYYTNYSYQCTKCKNYGHTFEYCKLSNNNQKSNLNNNNNSKNNTYNSDNSKNTYSKANYNNNNNNNNNKTNYNNNNHKSFKKYNNNKQNNNNSNTDHKLNNISKTIQEESKEVKITETINVINNNSVQNKANLCANLIISNQPVRALIDTGATLSCINKTLAEKLKINYEQSSVTIKSASNHFSKSIGTAMLNVGFDKLNEICKFEVFNDDNISSSCIVEHNCFVKLFYHIQQTEKISSLEDRYTGRIADDKNSFHHINQIEDTDKFIITKSLGIDQVELDETQINQFNSLFDKFKDITSNKLTDSGKATLIQHQIVLDNELVAKTKLFSNPYPTSPQEKLIIEEKIKDQLEAGVLIPINLLQPYNKFAAGITLAFRNGKYRFCADYRKLNSCTIKEPFPQLKTQDFWYYLKDAKIFSTLDLLSGYYQISIKPSDQHKTAINTHIGLFMYKCMPFGLTSAPATFQRFMNYIFKDHLRKFIIVYIDDFIIFSKNLAEHLNHLELVFKLLREFNLKVNIAKCAMLRSKLQFLGYTISNKGRSFQPEKFEKLKSITPPTNIKEVSKFLGSIGYYREFIKNYYHYTTPMYNLLKKGVEFKWSEDIEHLRQELLNKLSEAPILHYPTDTDNIIIETDASNYGIGAVLLMDNKIVSHYSRGLIPAEKNYSATEREALALVESIKRFHCYSNGKKVKVMTDHKPLIYLFSKSQFSGRLARWSLAIADANVEILYRAGNENHLPDLLSRFPNDQNKPLNDDSLEYAISLTSNNNSNIFSLSFNDNSNNVNSSNNNANTGNTGNKNDLFIFTEDKLLIEVIKDSYLRPIYYFIKDGYLPSKEDVARKIIIESEFYAIIDNILVKGFKHPQSNPSSPLTNLQIVIPKSLVELILEIFHDNICTGGHYGFEKTYNKIKDRFYWRGMIQDIRNYISSCKICNETKRRYGPHQGFLIPLNNGDYPFHTIGIDFLTLKHNKVTTNILVIIDYFTKWPEVFVTIDQSAQTVAMILFYQIFLKFGAPKKIISDRGKSFLNNIVDTINRFFEVTKISTSAYHPQTDGVIFIAVQRNSTPLYYNLIIFSYRITPHPSTGFSPFFLLFGRNPNLPTKLPSTRTIQFGEYKSIIVDLDVKNYADSLIVKYTSIMKSVSSKFERSKIDQSKYYNIKRIEPQIKPGDLVFLKVDMTELETNIPKKLRRPWSGPYKVISQKGPNTFKIEMNTNHHSIINIDRLKLYVKKF
ncbi:hypothetical protein ACTFIZ_010927 [Dictyostelium cf. discoideum]